MNTLTLYKCITSRIGELTPVENVTIINDNPFLYPVFNDGYRLTVEVSATLYTCKAMVQIAAREVFSSLQFEDAGFIYGLVGKEKVGIRLRTEYPPRTRRSGQWV